SFSPLSTASTYTSPLSLHDALPIWQISAEAHRVARDVSDGRRPHVLQHANLVVHVGELASDDAPRVAAWIAEGRSGIDTTLVDCDHDLVMSPGKDRLTEEGIGIKPLLPDVDRWPNVARGRRGIDEREALALQIG